MPPPTHTHPPPTPTIAIVYKTAKGCLFAPRALDQEKPPFSSKERNGFRTQPGDLVSYVVSQDMLYMQRVPSLPYMQRVPSLPLYAEGTFVALYAEGTFVALYAEGTFVALYAEGTFVARCVRSSRSRGVNSYRHVITIMA